MKTTDKKKACPVEPRGTENPRRHTLGMPSIIDRALHPNVMRAQIAAMDAYTFFDGWTDLSQRYQIVDKLGEGTFSTVYKAIDCLDVYKNEVSSATDSENDSDNSEFTKSNNSDSETTAVYLTGGAESKAYKTANTANWATDAIHFGKPSPLSFARKSHNGKDANQAHDINSFMEHGNPFGLSSIGANTADGAANEIIEPESDSFLQLERSFYCVPFYAVASVENTSDIKNIAKNQKMIDSPSHKPITKRKESEIDRSMDIDASFNVSALGNRFTSESKGCKRSLRAGGKYCSTDSTKHAPDSNLNTQSKSNLLPPSKRLKMTHSETTGNGEISRRPRRRYIALKRIYQTSAEQRIVSEVKLLTEVSGHPNIAGLLSLHRKEDQVVLVLAYFKHLETRDYFSKIPIGEQRYYFKHLMMSLAHIHSKSIIHRDVKPGNFLFNPYKRQGVLVDFGLAQKVDAGDAKRQKRETAMNGQTKRPHKIGDEDALEALLRDSKATMDAIELRYGRPGYMENDIRPATRANRAGTRGFRAPEVLLKVAHQTTAIDIWSVGVILLCFLTRRFPFFHSNDDIEALQEITLLFGSRRMRQLALQFDRVLITTVPTITKNGFSLRDVVYNVNKSEYGDIPNEAFDLLQRCLELDPSQRITASEALKHPFLRV